MIYFLIAVYTMVGIGFVDGRERPTPPFKIRTEFAIPMMIMLWPIAVGYLIGASINEKR